MRIQLALQKKGGLSYVFTIDGFSGNSVKGYIFNFKQKKWIEQIFPLPQVVYNKIPVRRFEKSHSFLEIKTIFHSLNIPFFNDSYFQKWELHQLLSQDHFLNSFLPYTERFDSVESFIKMSEKFKKLYVKPAHGRKGEGIFTVERVSQNNWNVQTISNEIQNVSFLEILNNWIPPHLEKDYIIQQAILPLRWHGYRFDYRVLVHRKSEQEFILSGIGVRQSQLQQVTTHLPAGGTIISLSDLPYKKDESIINEIANTTGRMLLKKYQNLGEFSMDIGKSENGNLYIFEVNSKPMVFDEEEIRRKGIENLVQFFIFLASNTVSPF